MAAVDPSSTNGKVTPYSSTGIDFRYLCHNSTVMSNQRYVLTAAHCFDTHLGEAVEVLLGEVDLNTDVDCISSSGIQIGCAPPPQKVKSHYGL